MTDGQTDIQMCGYYSSLHCMQWTRCKNTGSTGDQDFPRGQDGHCTLSVSPQRVSQTRKMSKMSKTVYLFSK